MSTVRQEVAAMLMDYAQQMPDQTYRDILHNLGEIPESRDPQDAKVYLDQIRTLEDTNTILSETLTEREEQVYDLQYELKQDWNETAISPPPEWLTPGHNPISTETQSLLQNITGPHPVSLSLNDAQLSTEINQLIERFTTLGDKYQQLHDTSQTLQFNNDYLRRHRQAEYSSLSRQLEQERQSNDNIHKQHLVLMSEQLGDITLTIDSPIGEPAVAWTGTFKLVAGEEANYCSVYQHSTLQDTYLYNINTIGSNGKITGREWVVCDIRLGMIRCRLDDKYESYLPPPSNRWFRKNQGGDWVMDRSIKISYEHPFRKYRLNAREFPRVSSRVDNSTPLNSNLLPTSDGASLLEGISTLWD